MRRAALVLGIVAPLLLAVSGPAGAQKPWTILQDQPPPQRHHPVAEDNHAVRFILKEIVKVEPIEDLEDLNTDPRHSVLILLGDTQAEEPRIGFNGPKNIAIFKRFVWAGGAVLVATDTNSADAIRRALGVLVEGDPPIVTRAPERDGYRKNENCPLVTEFNRSYPLFQAVGKIATNCPANVVRAAFTPNPPVVAPIAIAPFPNSCTIENKFIPNFAMVCEPRDGSRCLVLSDHSVFINSMMLQKDNDNFAFAINCARWLTEAEDGVPKRKRVLLIDDGEIEKSFAVPVKDVPVVMPPPGLADLPGHPVDIINALLAKWEDENIHNELLLGGSSWRQILSGTAIVVTILVLGYGLYRVQTAHVRVETGP